MSEFSKIAFSSAYRYERVSLKSSVAFSVAGGGFASTIITVTHSLGYKPYYKAWYTYGGKKFQLYAGTGSYNIDGNGGQIDNVNVTNTTFVVTVANFGAPAISGTIYYRIYAEPQI